VSGRARQPHARGAGPGPSVLPADRFLIALRVLRVLRVFRMLKLAHYLREASVLGAAVRASRYEITVFVSTPAS
jgi:voltage-gated potassium channel